MSYQRINDKLSINISAPARQNFDLLIEYNLLISELKQVLEFREWIYKENFSRIEEILNQHKVEAKAALEIERVSI